MTEQARGRDETIDALRDMTIAPYSTASTISYVDHPTLTAMEESKISHDIPLALLLNAEEQLDCWDTTGGSRRLCTHILYHVNETDSPNHSLLWSLM
jgi:hypothetical protein